MKPISELIKIIDSVNAVDLDSTKQFLDKTFRNTTGAINNADYHSKDVLENIQHINNIISAQHQQLKKTLQDYVDFIQQEITKQEEAYQLASNNIYHESLNDSAEYLLTRRKNNNLLTEDQDCFDIFCGRISEYNRWQHPALEIRPAFGQFTDIIKGCDPLYLLDTDENMFQQIKQRWKDAYQRRLCYYTYKETDNEMFHMLPKNQFGFVLSVDLFEYKNMKTIQHYLINVFTRLRPGGTFMFTYNDGGKVYGARNVENKFKCYTPGHELVKLAQDIGYVITKKFDDFENVSWLEITKPGKLKTLKGGQTLGTVKSFSQSELSKQERDAKNKANGIKV